MRACLLIPAGDLDPTELAAAIAQHHPAAELTAVWAGDPHLRPGLPPGVRWLDLDVSAPAGLAWGQLLVGLPPEAYEWARAALAAHRAVAGGDPILVLRVGSIGVDGALDRCLPTSGIVAAPMAPEHLPADGLAPGEPDLATAGAWSTAMLGVAPDAAAVLERLADTLARSAPHDPVGALVASVLSRSGHPIVPAPGVTVAGWHPSPCAAAPAAVVVDALDRAEPWHLAFDRRAPRVRLSGEPLLAGAIERTRSQWLGGRRPIALPGGVVVDDTIRSLVHAANAGIAAGGDPPPDPFAGTGLLDWLESPDPRSGSDLGRYWFDLWHRRPDLHVVFPRPAVDDRDRFVDWAARSWQSDGRSSLIRAGSQRLRPEWQDVGREPGVNLIGYVASDLGLGDFTRRTYRSLVAAGVPVGALQYHRSLSPRADDVPPLTTELRHDTNLVTVHPDQLRLFHADYGPTVFAGRRTIGYWFWELAHVPPRIASASRFVDEIWTPTEFVAAAFRAATDVPVGVVHVPVPEPMPAERTRVELGLPDDRFVFLVTFDHMSITERKNPVGAIEAFRRAFPTTAEDGPVLVVKTLNADQRWAQHEQVLLAAAGRPDVQVVDRHLARGEQMALIAASDCLVSLHRAEGLGLHLMEAMWLEVPVIATRYSGNVDFMHDDNAALVGFELVPVVDVEGYYPAEAVWADPDLDEAATWMRRFVEDRPLARRLAAAGRRTMMGQASLADTGRLIADAAGIDTRRMRWD